MSLPKDTLQNQSQVCHYEVSYLEPRFGERILRERVESYSIPKAFKQSQVLCQHYLHFIPGSQWKFVTVLSFRWLKCRGRCFDTTQMKTYTRNIYTRERLYSNLSGWERLPGKAFAKYWRTVRGHRSNTSTTICTRGIRRDLKLYCTAFSPAGFG